MSLGERCLRRAKRALWSLRAQVSLTESGIVGRGSPGWRFLRERKYVESPGRASLEVKRFIILLRGLEV